MTIFLFNYNANGGNAQGESRKYVWRCVKGRSAELRPGGVADEAGKVQQVIKKLLNYFAC